MTAVAARPRVSLIENFANGAAGHWGDNSGPAMQRGDRRRI